MSALRTLRVGADTPDWCIPRLGPCAASRFTADGCRLCCSTPELSAIPKLARNWLVGSEGNVPCPGGHCGTTLRAICVQEFIRRKRQLIQNQCFDLEKHREPNP